MRARVQAEARAGGDGADWWVITLVMLAVGIVSSTSLESQFTLPKLLCLQLGTPLLIALFVYRVWRGRVRQLPRHLGYIIAALVAWYCLVTVTAIEPWTALYGSYGRYNGLLTQLTLLTLFIIVATLPASPGVLERRAAIIVLTLLPVAAWAIAQFLGFDPRPWPNPRPASTIGHPVPLAAALALVAPIAGAFVIAERDTSRRRTGAVVLAVLAAAILLSLSRGPWAGAAVAAIVLGAWALRQGLVQGDRQLVAVVIILVLGVGVRVVVSDSNSLLRTRFLSIWNVAEDPSFVNRFTYADAGWRMLWLRPILGFGFDHFALLYPRYRAVEPPIVPLDQMPTKSHNGYLDRAVATGLPGLLLYLALVGYVMAALWRRAHAAREPDDGRYRLLAMSLLVSITGFLIQELSGWEELPLSVFFWVVMGLAVSVGRESEGEWRPRRSQLVAVTAVALLLATIVQVQALRSWRHVRAERILVGALRLDQDSVGSAVEPALALGAGIPHYSHVAGLLMLDQFAATRNVASYHRAAELFDRAIAGDSYDPYLLVHRIDLDTLAIQLKAIPSSSDAAARAAGLVTAIDPNNATVHAALARYYFAAGQMETALVSSSRAHRLRPGQPRYHLLDGDIYGATNRFAEQAAAYHAALGGADQGLWPEVVHKYGLALIRLEDYGTAAAELEVALRRAPDDAILHNLSGVAHLNLRDPNAAAAAFRRALDLDPANQSAQHGLAEAEQLRKSKEP